jgi:hypothetical protein
MPDVPPGRMLGRRPPARKATLNAVDFIRTLPDHPARDVAPALSWPMDRNDQAGTCGPASVDHALQAIHAQLGVPRTNWTDAQLLDVYRAQNPDFRTWADSDTWRDGGVVLQLLLEDMVRRGEIVAFAAVDHGDAEALRAAIWVGLALITGENLDVAQSSQAVWDYVPDSREWGGHATVSVAYDKAPGGHGVVTWGELVPVTQAFIDHQVEEAWFVLTRAHLAHPGFRDAFDIAGFARAVAELTDDKVVVPSPSPAPAPADDPLADFPWTAMNDWADRPHVWRRATTAARAYRAWRTEHRP